MRIGVREFAVQLRNDLTHGFGSTRGRGNDVVVGAATATPVLGRWSIDSLLSGCGRVDGAHETLDDAELVIEHFGKGSKTIRRA